MNADQLIEQARSLAKQMYPSDSAGDAASLHLYHIQLLETRVRELVSRLNFCAVTAQKVASTISAATTPQ